MNTTASQFQFGDMMLVAPYGDHPHPESGLVQVLDQIAANTLVAHFDGASAKPNFPGLLVDFDHFSYDPSKPSTAAGWITGLVKKTDGVWANVRWTSAGAQAVGGGDYRHCSPVFSRLEQLGGNRVRPIQLDSVGLTNKPNIKAVGTISNRLVLMNSQRASAPHLRSGQSGEPLTLEYICRAQRDLAQAHAKLSNRSFTDAWNHVANRFTVLRALMSVRPEETRLLLNRASDGRPAIGPLRTHDDAATQERFWDAVEKAADSVRDRFHSCHTWDGSAGSQSKWMGAAGYYDALKKLQARYGQGADRDLIWEKMKEQFPKEWADFILHHAHHQGIV